MNINQLCDNSNRLNPIFFMIANILQAVNWLLLYNDPNIGQSRGSNPGRDRPKLLKQVVTVPLPNARRECECHGSLEMTITKGWPLVTVDVAR